jgi:hypothetical protein
MSDIKIFATPEAYKLLTSVSDGEKTKSAVEAAFELISDPVSADYFIEGCPVALSAYWSEKSSEDSIILLDKHKGYMLNYDFDNYRVFFEKLETAVPISLA